MKNKCIAALCALCMAATLVSSPAWTQESDTTPQGEQDDVSKALDSTATQWSFQFAYQTTDYKDDRVDGETRPSGLDNYWQMRVVAPFVFDSFTLLPRLTLRHYENKNTGEAGWGNTELFGLIIPKKWDWGTGRVGIGPLVTAPGDEEVARDEWGYGFAAAAVNTSGDWFYGLLFTQSWRSINPDNLAANPATSDTNPLGIAPFLNYQLGDGWYVGNGDMVIQYDWNEKEFYVPINLRVGKVLVGESGSWNIYGEVGTSLLYKDWPGAAKDKSFRINVTRTIPGF